MKPEVAALIKVIADEAAILLSGFSGQGGDIAAALIRISEATAMAHLEETGELIDEAKIKPIEKLTLEDLPNEKTTARPDNTLSGDQVSGGSSAGQVQEDQARPEVPEA